MRRFASPAIVLASLSSIGCSQSAGPGLDGGLFLDGESGDTTAGLDASVADGSGDDGSRGALDDGPESGLADDATSGSPDAGGGTPDAAPDDAAMGSPDAPPREAGVIPCSAMCVHGSCVASGGCTCASGWGGTMCDMAAPLLMPGPPLVPGPSVAGSVMRGQWAYFSYRGLASGVTATLTEDTTVGLVWAYLGTGRTPDQSSNLALDENVQSASHSVTYMFMSPGTQTWYVGAYGQLAIPPATQAVAFHITITVMP